MKVAVVMGGISSEREISLMTGRQIAENLDSDKYEVYPVEIDSKSELVKKIRGMDFVFLALHGKYGEDGTIQGTLETLGIPYSGCGLISSAICMDKNISKKLMRFEGINTPDWIVINSEVCKKNLSIEKTEYPFVVKPNTGGSSIGAFIVKKSEELHDALEKAFKLDHEVIIEEYIKGDEITCPVLDGKMLPIVAINPRADFFDYSSKYDDGGAQEYVVELEEGLQNKVRDMAEKCYHILKCSVYARVDMIIKDGEPFVLEVNTLPGMTKNSLFPKSARAAAISFNELLEKIIELSIK